MKFKFLFLIVFNFCFLQGAFAQKWEWAQRIGNIKSDKATVIKTDTAGYIYVAGYFSDQLDLGTNNLHLNNTANPYSKEIFIAKYDSTGFCLWAKSGGAYYDDRILGMDVDANGNAVVTGTFWEGSGINIGPVNISGSAFGWGDQCFIAKFDKNGNVLWGNFVCSDGGDDQGLDVATDKKGNSYIVGFMGGNQLFCGGNTVTAFCGQTSFYDHSYWLAKINSSGQFQWAKTFGNLPFDTAYGKYIERDIAVCVDDKDGVFITGGFDHTRPFGNGTLTSTGDYDVFVMKYDTSGTFHWATRGGSKKDDWASGICTDKNGFLYVVGEHRDSLMYDTVIIKNYNKRDAFVMKFDASNGRPIWGKRAGSDLGGERGNGVIADNNCNIYVCGDINEGGKFGDNIIVPPGRSVESFVTKISPEGKWLWAMTGGGVDSNDRCNSVVRGKGNQLYACGFYRSPATFGTNGPLISAGASDAWIARIHDSSINKIYSFAFTRPTDTIFCLQGQVKLNIPDHAFLTWAPTTGVTANANQSELTFDAITTTTYTVSGFSQGLCPVYDTLIFTIIIGQSPVAAFNVNPTETYEDNPVFNLENTSTGAVSYEWYYENASFSTAFNEQKTLDSAGVYCFTLVATSQYGCKDTVSHCGTILKLEDYFIPNVFTPNGDGLNEIFKPTFLNMDIASIRNYSMVIVDRFGHQVFKSSDPTKGWDGNIKDTRWPDIGTFFYHCKFTSGQGKKYEKKGDVVLMR